MAMDGAPPQGQYLGGGSQIHDIPSRPSTDRNHLEHSQERMTSRLRAPPPMLRRVRCVPAYDVVSGETYLEDRGAAVRGANGRNTSRGGGAYMG